MLKTFASFYDPAGRIQPEVVKMKILFQAAWRLDLSWELFGEVLFRKGMTTLRISQSYRHSDESNANERVDLHVFSDASLTAYGECVYLKFLMREGDVETSLVASKSRLAPLKNVQTFSGLELMGNVVLAQV